MMEMPFGMIEEEKKCPPWLLGQTAIIIQRGKKMWWSKDDLVVIGPPPTGMSIYHEVISVPGDWGPQGFAEQVAPDAVIDANETLTFVNKRGKRLSQMSFESYRFLNYWFDDPLVFIQYEDGDRERPQVMAVFQRIPTTQVPQQITDIFGILGIKKPEPERTAFGDKPATRDYDLEIVAFIAPRTENPEYFIDEFDTAVLPRFSGAKTMNGLGG